MTSPFAAGPTSTDTRALQEINSTKKSFVNKDFAKNMAYLNNSVDTLSQWSQKLQSGVDQANENIFEQISGFAGDLFVVFAGLEPTGIELGDLKYVIQGLGAMFGINPSTPFPMNLIDAALHMFSTYILPLDQFTDVIFDAIFAWAEDLGLSPAFTDSMHSLLDAISRLGATFYDLFDSLSDLLGAFGFLGFTSTSGLGDIWDSLLDIITVITTPLKPVLNILADLGIPFINALTGIINSVTLLLSPLSFISGGQITELGDNFIPKPMNDTTVWGVSASIVSGWFFDSTQSSGSISPGSFTTLGNSTGKTMVAQTMFACQADQKFAVNAMLKWIGIPSSANDFGLSLLWFIDATPAGQFDINISSGHGSSGGWSEIAGTVTVPSNVTGFKMAVRVGSSITTGQVWVDDISARLQGFVQMNIVSGLIDAISSLIPWGFFDSIIGAIAGPDSLLTYFGNLLNPSSPISVFNLFGLLPPWVLPGIPVGNLTDSSPELLIAPTFDTADVIQLGQNWSWDGSTGRNSNGSLCVTGNSIERQVVSNKIEVKANDVIAFSTWYKWQTAIYGGTNHITLGIVGYVGDTIYGYNNIQQKTMDAYSNPTWQQLSGNFTVPDTITHVALQLRLGSNVSSGLVFFDDCSMKRTNNQLPQSWIINLIPDMFGLQEFAEGIIGSIRTVIFGIPFVGGTLGQLFDALTGWHADTQATAAQAGDALLIATTVEPIVYNTFATVEVVQTKAVTQQNYSISSATDLPRQPSWVCRYPVSDVSFPEAWNSLIEVFGTTDGASAGTAHTHTLNLSGSVYSSPAGFSITNGNSRGVFLNITNTTAFTHMRLYAWVPSGTATDVTYGLHRVRDDGSSYEIISAKQIAPQLTSDGQYIDVDLGGTLIVQAGETYLLRITNRSAAAVAVAAISQTTGANYNGFATTGLTLSNATSYTAAQITTGRNATGQVNFGGLFSAATFYTPKTYTDDFNRPEFGELWVPWANSFGAGAPHLHINFANGEGRAAYTGTVDGDESNVYLRPTGSDQTIVSADMWGISGTARCGIFCHASREAKQLAYLGVGASGVNLYAGEWGFLAPAKANFASSVVDGSNWGIYVDPTGPHSIFHIMKDNTDVAAWTDSTDLMKIGSDYRYGGKIISRIAGVNAGEIDNWTMTDVA